MEQSNLALISVADLKAFISENSIKNEVFDTKGAAEYLKISVSTVKKLAATNKIPAVKVGDNWRFSSIALYNFLNNRGEVAR